MTRPQFQKVPDSVTIFFKDGSRQKLIEGQKDYALFDVMEHKTNDSGELLQKLTDLFEQEVTGYTMHSAIKRVEL